MNKNGFFFEKIVDCLHFWTIRQKRFWTIRDIFLSQIFKTAFYLSQEKLWGKRFAWKISNFENLSECWAKTLGTFGESFWTRFSILDSTYRGDQLQLKKSVQQTFSWYIFSNIVQIFFLISTKLSCMVVESPVCVTGVSFSGNFFSKTNFCSFFIGFGRNISKLLVKKFQ